MIKYTNIWLLRHGEIDCPASKSFIGQWDLPLSVNGKQQIHSWQDFFVKQNIEAILSSDLIRCRQSVHELNLPDIPIIYDAKFREISLGDWEGQPIANIKTTQPNAYAKRGQNLDTFCPPKGESFNDLSARVHKALYSYLSNNNWKNILLLSHAGVNRVIIANYLSLPLKYVLNISQSYACCTKVVITS